MWSEKPSFLRIISNISDRSVDSRNFAAGKENEIIGIVRKFLDSRTFERLNDLDSREKSNRVACIFLCN